MKIFFWGAGKIGLNSLQCAKTLEIMPYGFIDSNNSNWGKCIDGLEVYAPDILYDIHDYEIIITCASFDEVRKKLLLMGVSRQRIFSSSELILKLFELGAQHCNRENDVCRQFERIIFELQNDWVLGGVESWAYEMADILRCGGYDAKLLLFENGLKRNPYPPDEMLVLMPQKKEVSFVDELKFERDYIDNYAPAIIVTNFVGTHFYAACLCKIKCSDRIKIIAVIHNDNQLYYDAYARMEDCISTCFYISIKMRDEMLKRGFPERKLQYLPWKVNVDQDIKHRYSDVNMPIKLGYAGRMTKLQKRVDMFLYLLQRLDELAVDFRCDFAGEGDYLEDFEQEALKLELQDKISCLGMLSKEDIYAFWQEHDIYLSCSEWEGHSISQVEAMANGAVPIVTNVSGARDDVHDGENGFVVAVGDIESMAHRIKYLYEHREILSCMGRRAASDMRKKYSQVDIMKIWREIL